MARHPELGLLRFSPSVGAIELAGKMFPVSKAELKLEDQKPALQWTVQPAPVSSPGAGPMLLLGSLALMLLPVAAAFWARRAMQ